MSLLLGIDPSLCATGWITVDENRIAFGAVMTEPENKKRHCFKSDDTTRRLALILDKINDVGAAWTDKQQIACEQPAGAQSASAASALGEVHGALVGLFYAWSCLDDVRWIPASDGKRALTGHKSASKKAMIDAAGEWLEKRGAWKEFGLLTKRAQEAVADALGVLLASGLLKKGNADGGAG